MVKRLKDKHGANANKTVLNNVNRNENSNTDFNDAKNGSSDDSLSDQEDELHTVAVDVVREQNRKRSLRADGTIKTKKAKMPEKVKPPTVEEINELKETRNLYHSNLFRLQVKEMLIELKIKNKYTSFITAWLEKFNTFLKELDSESEKQDVSVLQWLQKTSIKIPLSLDHVQSLNGRKIQFQFIKPKEASYLIGSAATNTLLGPKLVVDIAVTMPLECFQKDNYLNLVYDQKRALYLTYIATKMLETQCFEGLGVDLLKFNYYGSNPLKPVLEVGLPSSAGSIANKLSIRIFIAPEETSFKLSRFVPWNNNIRGSLCGEEDDDAVPLATPNYNAGVLFDLTMKRNHLMMLEVFGNRKNFQEGLILLKVWLQQRQLNVGFSGFHNHILAMFICYLYKQRKLHNNMSSYQVARNVWNQLACSRWNENLQGITLNPTNASDQTNQPTIEQFHSCYDVVFIDATGFHNICANLSTDIYRRVQTESKIAVENLNNMKLNSFQSIFMTKYPIYTQLDHIIKINKSDVIEQILEIHSTPADRCNYICNFYPQILKIVTKLLQKGVGHRVHNILPIEQPIKSWSANEKAPGLQQYLHLGLILNPEQAYEVLDKGPESFADGAEEFRKFWGEQAQLRRFQDGTITEAVVWGKYSDTLSKKRIVVRSIVLYLLKYHLQVESEDIEYIAGQFDVAFKLNPLFKTENMNEKIRVEQNTDAETLALNVIRCFDDLRRKFHSLIDLPLDIVSIAGISPTFRYCDPEPILPQACCIQEKFYANKVLWGVIQLGVSGKWPSELAALRALKTAFYIQIAQLLRKIHKCRAKVTYDGVLVLKNGYVFGFEIAHQKEVALLKKEESERGVLKCVDSEASRALEKRLYMLPKITGALHGLHQTYPSFGATVMIAKRWLYSQLIDDGVWPEECTELLIASQYLRIHEQQLPCQPQTSFFRFLQLLGFTDWKTELFLINFNNEMDENSVAELENRFNSERSSFPPLCIATAYDLGHHGLIWTSNLRPNENVLARVTLLARQALSIIESTIVSSTEQFIKPSKLFMTSNRGYDLVIQLKPDLVSNSLAAEFSSSFAGFSKPNFRQPLVDINYLKDAVARLREAYADYAAFFYNPCGGKEIGVIWKPDIFCEREFKVSDMNGSVLSSDGTKVQHKQEVFIEDFKVILKDFYLRIDTVEKVLTASQQGIQHNKKKINTISSDITNKKTKFNEASKRLQNFKQLKKEQ